MKNILLKFVLAMLFCLVSKGICQTKETPLQIFGYFQNEFVYYSDNVDVGGARTSFLLQQLNLFFQKDFADNWRAFINIEMINSYSSGRRWGAANLEEAWVRRYFSRQFQLKLGMHLPTFNHLNTIKNITPVLPYIVRPLVYESSFSEFIAIEEFLPGRAYAQIYGNLQQGRAKIDYSFYIGNSSNINSDPTLGQTGVDTTTGVMVGGRIGLRFKGLKMGVSGTWDETNQFEPFFRFISTSPAPDFEGVNRIRFGGDFSFELNRWHFQNEFIGVFYDTGDFFDLDRQFLYSTLSYQVNGPVLLYAGFWYTRERGLLFFEESGGEMPAYSKINPILTVKALPTIGIAVSLNDRLTMKAQFARIDAFDKTNIRNIIIGENFRVFALAASVFF